MGRETREVRNAVGVYMDLEQRSKIQATHGDLRVVSVEVN